MRFMRRLMFLGLVIGLVGCAGSPRLPDYPGRKIDRPITLPKGMSEARIMVPLGYSKITEFYDLKQPYPFYAYWTHALSDQLSFIWYGLPLGIRFKAYQGDQYALGLEFLGHIGPPDTPYLSPYFTLINRFRIEHELELEVRFGTQSVLHFKRGGVDWTHVLESGPRWQLNSTLSIRPWIALLREENPSLRSWSVPVGLSAAWNMIRQVDIELSYIHTGIGTRIGNVQGSTGSLELTYFW